MDGNESFTLIELLVVIAIIGLLASVVLVSMGGIQGKAKITNTLEFSSSAYHALGAYAVGSWSFDEGSGTVAFDASGNGNNGTINGATYSIDTPHAAIGRGMGKYALIFDGVNDSVDIPSGASASGFTAGSLEMWVKLSSVPAVYKAAYADVRQTDSYRLQMAFYSNAIPRFAFIKDGGGEVIFNANSALNIDTWYHIVAVFDGAADEVNMYVNGVSQGATGVSFNSVIDTAYHYINIGGRQGSSGFPGEIDEVRIYEKALTLGEIQKHYAEGLGRHKDLATK